MQLAIAAGVVVLATGLFLAPLSNQLDDQAMRRALAIAQTTAAEPQIAEDLQHSRPTVDGPVQREAERIRKASGAEYVVVMDLHGIRWSHTDPAEVGGHVSTDPQQGPGRPGRHGDRQRHPGPLGPRQGAAARRRRQDHRRGLGRHRVRQRARPAHPRDPRTVRLRRRRPRRGCAGGLADLPADPAADPRPGLLGHLRAARRARGDAARHPGGRRRPGPRRPRPPAQRRGAAPAGHRRRGRRAGCPTRRSARDVRPTCWPAG